MDCSLPDWFSGVGTLLIGVAAMWTIGYGVLRGKDVYKESRLNIEQEKLRLKRNEEQNKFKFQVAKESIDLFSKAQTAISIVRSPMVREKESETLQNLEEINEFIKKMKRSHEGGITLLRWDERGEVFFNLAGLRPKFKVVFGTDKPFSELFEIWNKIKIDATIMVMLVDQERADASWYDRQKMIYDLGEEDEVSKKIKNVVESVDEYCVPVIRGEVC